MRAPGLADLEGLLSAARVPNVGLDRFHQKPQPVTDVTLVVHHQDAELSGIPPRFVGG
jgi:hypothetical protein